ncbi:MAG: hypothetical protein NFW15_11225, partial [Candidatus Accumulibacter sp.]|nr:hypothetical protein [Accumulibacter sp.]MCM8640271.1 hypothetical protein [Accumulibacter sp.]
MDPTRDPRFERARHLAGAELRPEHYTDFQRLLKTLRFGSRFQLLICEFNDVPYREALIARLDDVLAVAKLASARLALAGAPHPDFAAVEAALRGLAAGCDAVHVCGGESWFSPPGDMAAGRWEAFNLRREAIARDVPLRILLWLTTAPIRQLALRAPDLWAWRSGIFSFTLADQPAIPALHPFDEAIDRRSLVERTRRIGELRSALGSAAALPEDLRLGLLDELAELLRSVGELDEALRIRLEEELPVHEKLGNVRSKALTQGQIADILQARGQLDEALRIRLEEQLPVFEKLGDVRSKAVTQGQIADILQARGQL